MTGDLFLSYTVNNSFVVLNVEPDDAERGSYRLKGENLLDIISDETLRYLMRTLMQRILRTGQSACLEYRCDTPDLRRKCLMTVAVRHTSNGDVLQVNNFLVSRESRDHVSLLEPEKQVGPGCVHMCSWCKKVLIPDGTWVEVEAALDSMHLMECKKLPMLSHAMCPSCQSYFLAKIPAETGNSEESEHVPAAPVASKQLHSAVG